MVRFIHNNNMNKYEAQLIYIRLPMRRPVPDNSVPVAYNITVSMVLDYVYVTRVNVYSGGVLASVLTEGLRYLST